MLCKNYTEVARVCHISAAHVLHMCCIANVLHDDIFALKSI